MDCRLVLTGSGAIIGAMSDYRDTYSAEPEIPDHRGVLAAAALMAVFGWAGLYLLVTTTIPTAFPRWLFFVSLYFAVTGTVLPFVRFLTLRFLREDAAVSSGGVLLRESIWIGLFVVACAWLQIPRVLNPAIAFFLALSLLVVEVFLRIRERAQPDS